jgi:hypothetical protein
MYFQGGQGREGVALATILSVLPHLTWCLSGDECSSWLWFPLQTRACSDPTHRFIQLMMASSKHLLSPLLCWPPCI